MATLDPIKIRAMIPEEIPDDSLSTAIDDAPIKMAAYGVSETNPRFDFLARHMVCHMLYLRGFGRILLSAGVGDLSTGYADLSQGEKENMSPYLYEFLTVLNQSPFVISV